MKRTGFALALLVAGTVLGGDAADGFARQNAAAMTRMMVAMEVAPTGDVDRDFVAMMTPHHQGAIDMAALELRYGRNERLRRLAQEIVVTQKDEIQAMTRALESQEKR